MASEKRIMPCGGTFRSCDGACWKCSESKAKTDTKTESDDTISRQAAIDALERKKDKNAKGDIGGFYNKIIQNDIDTLAQLPSAERRGQWIMHIDDLFPAESTMECDQCHEEQPLECDDKYCPNCGVRMR